MPFNPLNVISLLNDEFRNRNYQPALITDDDREIKERILNIFLAFMDGNVEEEDYLDIGNYT